MAGTTGTPMLDFFAYLADHPRDFTRREWVFRAVDARVANPAGSRVFFLGGGPGSEIASVKIGALEIGDLSPRKAFAHMAALAQSGTCLATFHVAGIPYACVVAPMGTPSSRPARWGDYIF